MSRNETAKVFSVFQLNKKSKNNLRTASHRTLTRVSSLQDDSASYYNIFLPDDLSMIFAWRRSVNLQLPESTHKGANYC